MSRSLFLAALTACTLTVSAQSLVTNQHLFDTTAFIPEHGARRMAQFAKEPLVIGGILFLGDSITEGGRWGELLGDSSAVNRGIGGDITYGVLRRLDEVVAHGPSSLFLLIGVNDIGKDIPDAVIADNVRKIIQRLRAGSPGTAIYLQSLLPVNPDVQGFPQHYDKAAHVANTNRLLRIVAASLEVPFVDLYSTFVDERGRLDAKYTNDGLHLNQAGYEVWVGLLRREGYL